MKYMRIMLASVCLSLLLFGGIPALAAPPVQVHENHAVVNFPASIEFMLHVTGAVPVEEIRLQYRVGSQEYAEVVAETFIDITPAREQQVSWLWDMRKTGGLPPGSEVEYWWLIRTANGVETTPVQTLEVADLRFEWRSLEQGGVTVYWYRGESEFADALLAAAGDALSLIESFTGARPDEGIKFYVYGSTDDLRGSMIYPQEWTGGVAFTDFSVIAIGIGPQDIAWGTRAIAHEITHLVIHQITNNPYGDIPTWLDEGLAMMAEGLPATPFAAALQVAVNDDRLDSVQTLASTFSAFAEKSLLAYAESHSIVSFLVEGYGADAMFAMLTEFSHGSTSDDALKAVYGFDMQGLDAAWRPSLGLAPVVAAPESLPEDEEPEASNINTLLIVILAIALISTLGLAIWRVRRRGLLGV